VGAGWTTYCTSPRTPSGILPIAAPGPILRSRRWPKFGLGGGRPRRARSRGGGRGQEHVRAGQGDRSTSLDEKARGSGGRGDEPRPLRMGRTPPHPNLDCHLLSTPQSTHDAGCRNEIASPPKHTVAPLAMQPGHTRHTSQTHHPFNRARASCLVIRVIYLSTSSPSLLPSLALLLSFSLSSLFSTSIFFFLSPQSPL
jgi:hypothetical protein